MTKQNEKLKYYLFTIIGTLFVGSTTPVLKHLLNSGVDVYLAAFCRIAIPIFFATGILAATKQKPDFAAFRRLWKPILLMSFCGQAGLWMLTTIALQYAPAGQSMLIYGINPVLIIVLAYLILKEPMGKRRVIGTITAVFGVTLCMIGGSNFNVGALSISPWDMIFILTALLWAVYCIIMRIYCVKIQVYQCFFWLIVCSIILFMPFVLPRLYLLKSLNGEQIFWLVYLGVVPGSLGFLSWNIGLNTIGAVPCGLINSFLPVTAVVISTIWLGESIAGVQAMGAVIVIISVWQGLRCDPSKNINIVSDNCKK